MRILPHLEQKLPHGLGHNLLAASVAPLVALQEPINLARQGLIKSNGPVRDWCHTHGSLTMTVHIYAEAAPNRCGKSDIRGTGAESVPHGTYGATMIPTSLSQTESPSSMVGAVPDIDSDLGQQPWLPPAAPILTGRRGLSVTACPRCSRIVGKQPNGRLYRHSLPVMQRRWPKMPETCPEGS